MARQKGIIKLKGSIGDITFYKTKDGYLAREKGGIDKERFHNDPKFQRTRENAAEFGRAGKASKTLCSAIRPVLNKTQDSRMISRLVREMMKVIKADSTSDRGMRNVLDGELVMLQGFDFNVNAPLSTTIYAPYTTLIDRENADGITNIPSFVPETQLMSPRGTTHYRFISAIAGVDFEQEDFSVVQQSSDILPLDSASTTSLDLTLTLGVTGFTSPLFLLFGVEFLQEVNGSHYSLNNGAYNALSLVLVDA